MPQLPQIDSVVLEGVEIILRNFKGRKTPYNEEGKRNFGVLLTEDVAQDMAAKGWNVKVLNPREDDEEGVGRPWLPVAIRFDVYPPKIVQVTSRQRTYLDEETVESLDYAEIVNVDVIVRAYPYDFDGREGVKAYVKTMFVTINEDPLEVKYAESEPAV